MGKKKKRNPEAERITRKRPCGRLDDAGKKKKKGEEFAFSWPKKKRDCEARRNAWGGGRSLLVIVSRRKLKEVNLFDPKRKKGRGESVISSFSLFSAFPL